MAKSIMIQGTMSNVGKSLLTAGLCRILKQDGYKVAPFKSQNMALNSYITEEGLEMGRAQVMQAEACGIKPSVHMNPILLKPTTDMGSQVIVNGEVIGNMKAVDYFKFKKSLIPDILKAYHKLEEEFDIIIIEGAGSPAEINLKQEDIVNMGMAKLVDSPVLLVGDIDRGGVFAQLIGTVMLLEEEEKDRIKALIVNKFRGDKSILAPGIDMLEEKSGKKVAGVIPYMYLDIDDEDSLSERFQNNKVNSLIDIAVIKLPRISNFTDFNVFESIEEVSLRYIVNPKEIKDADVIIIPGTKSTMNDLMWMRQNGLEAAIKQQASQGKLIIGICGGYQILGEKLSDPYHIEGFSELNGMGLLPVVTTFIENKIRTRVKGRIGELTGELRNLSGKSIEGYEIHMGITVGSEIGKFNPFAYFTDLNEESGGDKTDGNCRNNVFGTYLHGIFDKEDFLEAFIKLLYERKGLEYDKIHIRNRESYKEEQYNKLAQVVRENLDMNLIYDILDLK